MRGPECFIWVFSPCFGCIWLKACPTIWWSDKEIQLARGGSTGDPAVAVRVSTLAPLTRATPCITAWKITVPCFYNYRYTSHKSSSHGIRSHNRRDGGSSGCGGEFLSPLPDDFLFTKPGSWMTCFISLRVYRKVNSSTFVTLPRS
jgi:hypothetical protein